MSHFHIYERDANALHASNHILQMAKSWVRNKREINYGIWTAYKWTLISTFKLSLPKVYDEMLDISWLVFHFGEFFLPNQLIAVELSEF